MHILDALDQYLVQLHADGRSPHTRGQARRHVSLLASWLASENHTGRVEVIDHQAVAQFLVAPCAITRPDGRSKKATAMNALRSSLRCFFGYLHGLGETCGNPARLVRLARTASPPPRALSDEEEKRLILMLGQAATWAERRDQVLFRTMLETGVRLGSALALQAEDLDLEQGEIWLQKTKGDRPCRVFAPEATLLRLADWAAEIGTGPLFLGQAGQPLGARQAHRRFKKLLERAQITRPASPHALRHTFGTNLYRHTGDILVVKEALHHRSVASSLVYARCSEDRLRKALIR